MPIFLETKKSLSVFLRIENFKYIFKEQKIPSKFRTVRKTNEKKSGKVFLKIV